MTLVPEIYTFTRDELEGNWSWLQERAWVLEDCVKEGVPPSLNISDYEGIDTSFNQCNNCGYAHGVCPAERRGQK